MGWVRGGGAFQLRIRTFRAFNWLLAIGVASIPTLEQFGKIHKTIGLFGWDLNWLWLYLPGLVVVGLINHITSGAGVSEWERYHVERAGVLAGNIDALARHIAGAPVAQIDRIIAGLLQAIADATHSLAGMPANVKVTAALLRAKPHGRHGKRFLHVVARNQLHASRPHSTISLDNKGPASVAYNDRRRVVEPDTLKSPAAKDFEGRPYRSVAAFPVLAAGVGPECAIVTIDATKAGALTEELFDNGLEEAVSPYLKLIGLAIHAGNNKGGS